MTTYTSETSFVDALVQTHLAPILEASIPTNPFSTGEIDIEEWIATFEQKLSRIARNLCQQLYTVNSIASDDLMQEARLAIWQMTKRYNSSMGLGGFRNATLKRARGAMLDYISHMNRTPARSLHEYLTFDDSPDSGAREIAAPSTPTRKTSLSMRRYVLAMLRRASLTEKEQLAIMTSFTIDNANGSCFIPDDIMQRFQNRKAFIEARLRALIKLRKQPSPKHGMRKHREVKA